MKFIVNCTIMEKLITYLFLLTCFSSPGQEEKPNSNSLIEIDTKHTFHSKVLNEEREIWVSTPTGYDFDSTIEYPVVYVLDGKSNFMYVASLLKKLEDRSVPKSIVVAVVNTDRQRDMTPGTINEKGILVDKTAGGADNFMKMFEEDLFPYMERNFQVNDFRTLVGHSRGGLFALYSLVTDPELFDAHLSISPSLWWKDQKMVLYFERSLKENPDLKGLLYMTMGNEQGTMLGGLMKVVGVLESIDPKNLRWAYKVHPQENHGSVPLISNLEGFQFFYRDWHAPYPSEDYINHGLETFKLRSKRIKNEFGQDWDLSTEEYSGILYVLTQRNLFEEQLKLGLKLIENDKKEVEIYEAVARSYLERGDKNKAIQYYKEAYKLNPNFPGVNKMLDSLKITKSGLIPTFNLKTEELKKYAGKYSDGELLFEIKLVDHTLTVIDRELHFEMNAEMVYFGNDKFYLPSNGFWTFDFQFEADDQLNAKFLNVHQIDGLVKKLMRLN